MAHTFGCLAVIQLSLLRVKPPMLTMFFFFTPSQHTSALAKHKHTHSHSLTAISRGLWPMIKMFVMWFVCSKWHTSALHVLLQFYSILDGDEDMLFMHVDNPGGNGTKKTQNHSCWADAPWGKKNWFDTYLVNVQKLRGQRDGAQSFLSPQFFSSCNGKAQRQRQDWFHKFWLLLTNRSITLCVCVCVCACNFSCSAFVSFLFLFFSLSASPIPAPLCLPFFLLIHAYFFLLVMIIISVISLQALQLALHGRADGTFVLLR